MDLLIQKRQKEIKKKQKSQIPYAIIAIVFSIVISAILWRYNHKFVAYFIIGIGFGISLRYSRFCFSGAFRDFIFLGNTKLFKSLLLAMMVSTIGFGVIQYMYLKNNAIDYLHIPGVLVSVGPHIAIGAFIFGIGMTIAGGCASGILMRIGEGHTFPWVVLIGFLIGSTLGAKDYPFWYEKVISSAKIIYFPEYIDIKVVIILQLVVLVILYKLASLYENKKLGKR